MLAFTLILPNLQPTATPTVQKAPKTSDAIGLPTQRSDALPAVAIFGITIGAIITVTPTILVIDNIFSSSRIRHLFRSHTSPPEDDVEQLIAFPYVSSPGFPDEKAKARDVNPYYKKTIRRSRSWRSMKSWKSAHSRSSSEYSASIYAQSPTETEFEEEYVPPRRYWETNGYGNGNERRGTNLYDDSLISETKRTSSYYSVYYETEVGEVPFDVEGRDKAWEQLLLSQKSRERLRPDTATRSRYSRTSKYTEFGEAWIQVHPKKETPMIKPLPPLPDGSRAANNRVSVRMGEALDNYKRYWKHPLSWRRGPDRITFF